MLTGHLATRLRTVRVRFPMHICVLELVLGSFRNCTYIFYICEEKVQARDEQLGASEACVS